ncbi:MAG: cytochrome c [Proteobacteria bacterium]|nr:cytochrome c [Pseudomonadota bacterium]MDA0994659.1 cytochrome c [Pseudomonadota bacterium]
MKRFLPAIRNIAVGVACTMSFAVPGNVMAQDGDAASGKDLYYAHGCYGCHGFNGETGARNLVGTGSPLIANVDTFLIYLRARADYAPLIPTTRMPSYPESALNDADARDIFAYLRTFELNAPKVEDIPALQAILESAGQQSEER